MTDESTLQVFVAGDVVGKPGRRALSHVIPAAVDGGAGFVVVNGENAAGGSGLTAATTEEILSYGVDVITSGDHIFKNRAVNNIIDAEPRLLRPANFPDGVPGRGYGLFQGRSGAGIAVINLLGRTFMQPKDCPFKKAETILEKLDGRAKIIIVDFHAEATSEKIALARFLDGRVSLVFGTHTHVQTADECILPGGTAFITDAGMTGPFESVLGRDIAATVRKFRTQMPVRLDVAKRDLRVCGVRVSIDPATGRAVAIERVEEKIEGGNT